MANLIHHQSCMAKKLLSCCLACSVMQIASVRNAWIRSSGRKKWLIRRLAGGLTLRTSNITQGIVEQLITPTFPYYIYHAINYSLLDRSFLPNFFNNL